jgi:phytoene dehydrogenase-like protein
VRNWDAIVIGSGPNGLSAAASIAEAGFSVLVIEASQEIGGGTRTLPLTLPGFRHDICSAIHPLAISSPAFSRRPLAEYGLEWVHPAIPLAHALDGGQAIAMERSLRTTADRLGEDGEAYYRLLAPAVDHWQFLNDLAGGKCRTPRDSAGLLRLALQSARSAVGLMESRFRGAGAKALLAGLAGHANLPLEDAFSAGFGISMGASGHAVGWPFPRGGAGRIAGALAGYLRSLGVEFETGARVNSLDDLPPHRIALCDISPRELLRISGSRLHGWFRARLAKFRYGPGAFKLDWALDGPIPWTAADCHRAGTVHVGGTADEIAAGERTVWEGNCAENPFVIVAQHTRFDPSRAPVGKHTAWAYCHVPNGSQVDMSERIEGQIERFAPGFRNRILARSVLGPMALEARNANLVGGDFCGGANSWRQLFTRPTLFAYLTPDPRILLCSSATPPGAGVHGMCGYYAARVAISRLRQRARTRESAKSEPTAAKVVPTRAVRVAVAIAIGAATLVRWRRRIG